jgi:hypothetical protein
LFRLLIFYVALASFAAAACPENRPNDNGAFVELPKLPTYPKDGKFPPAFKDQYVFLTEKGDEALVTFPSEAGEMTRQIAEKIVLKTGICPAVALSITKTELGFVYEYQVSNLNGATQPIAVWALPLPFRETVAVSTSFDWHGTESNPTPDLQASNLAYIMDITQLVDKERAQQLRNRMMKRKIDWYKVEDKGPVVTTISPFKVRSKALPGIVMPYFQGESVIGASSNWPPDVLGQALTLNWAENDSVSLLMVGPKFEPGTNRVAMAMDYLGVIDDAIKDKRLRTSPFLEEAKARLLSGAGRGAPWASKPVTSLEKQILSGMELSLY